MTKTEKPTPPRDPRPVEELRATKGANSTGDEATTRAHFEQWSPFLKNNPAYKDVKR